MDEVEPRRALSDPVARSPLVGKASDDLPALSANELSDNQADGELEDLRARYHGVLNATLDAILILDSQGCYVEANPAATELLGYSRDELLGMQVGQLPAAGPAWTSEERSEFVRRGRWHGEMMLQHKDGRTLNVQVAVTALSLSREILYIAALREASLVRPWVLPWWLPIADEADTTPALPPEQPAAPSPRPSPSPAPRARVHATAPAASHLDVQSRSGDSDALFIAVGVLVILAIVGFAIVLLASA